MTPIPVIHSFARSGGTLVNQLLGVHPQCLVLSEVNPAGSCKPVVEQAVEWLGLLAPGDAADFSCLPYRQQISRLHAAARERAKRLVVRDWVTVNFLPGTAMETTMPSRRLEQEIYLHGAGFEPRPLVVARRARTVYDSIRRSFEHFRNLSLDEFATSYLAYARAVSGFPVIHLEDLRADPVARTTEALAHLGIDPHDAHDLVRRFADFRNCTGNTTLAQPAGSSNAAHVLPPASDGDEPPSDPALAEADALLGYGR